MYFVTLNISYQRLTWWHTKLGSFLESKAIARLFAGDNPPRVRPWRGGVAQYPEDLKIQRRGS